MSESPSPDVGSEIGPFYEHTPELAGELTAHDFGPGVVEIEMEDGSHATFRYAFYRREGEGGRHLVVYTEHAGYHVFPVSALQRVCGKQRP